ncbi:hypothetical protein BURPS1710b_A0090 [Burkholderia pseudomallei 1710b]|uniref:Uncharacterized protein n=1 Tax=Burkholderia pseudomallei (strain 1710b) TaxID=320372 RepID=Q3JMF5_BURP1|nr:hypothetical protein BURPS1710b_A0090 [Burkholderia pseudomallei 1710b]
MCATSSAPIVARQSLAERAARGAPGRRVAAPPRIGRRRPCGGRDRQQPFQLVHDRLRRHAARLRAVVAEPRHDVLHAVVLPAACVRLGRTQRAREDRQVAPRPGRGGYAFDPALVALMHDDVAMRDDRERRQRRAVVKTDRRQAEIAPRRACAQRRRGGQAKHREIERGVLLERGVRMVEQRFGRGVVAIGVAPQFLERRRVEQIAQRGQQRTKEPRDAGALVVRRADLARRARGHGVQREREPPRRIRAAAREIAEARELDEPRLVAQRMVGRDEAVHRRKPVEIEVIGRHVAHVGGVGPLGREAQHALRRQVRLVARGRAVRRPVRQREPRRRVVRGVRRDVRHVARMLERHEREPVAGRKADGLHARSRRGRRRRARGFTGERGGQAGGVGLGVAHRELAVAAEVVMQRAEVAAAQVVRIAVARERAVARDQVLQVDEPVLADRHDAAREQPQLEAGEPDRDVVVELHGVIAVMEGKQGRHRGDSVRSGCRTEVEQQTGGDRPDDERDVRQLQAFLAYPVAVPQPAEQQHERACGEAGRAGVEPRQRGRVRRRRGEQQPHAAPHRDRGERLQQHDDRERDAVQRAGRRRAAQQRRIDGRVLPEQRHAHRAADGARRRGECLHVVDRDDRRPAGDRDGVQGLEQIDAGQRGHRTHRACPLSRGGRATRAPFGACAALIARARGARRSRRARAPPRTPRTATRPHAARRRGRRARRSRRGSRQGPRARSRSRSHRAGRS